MRDNAASLLETAYWGLAISVTVLAVTTAAVVVIAGYWTFHLAGWTAGRARHRWDRYRMYRRRGPQLTRNNQAVDDYWTIRRTWHLPTREEARR